MGETFKKILVTPSKNGRFTMKRGGRWRGKWATEGPIAVVMCSLPTISIILVWGLSEPVADTWNMLVVATVL